MDVEKLYSERFSENDLTSKNQIWQILTKYFFQKFISLEDVVVDIGAGYCEFINNIRCRKKIAVDINPAIHKFAQKDIQIIAEKSTSISDIKSNSVHVVFMSNFLEHLRSKEEILATFAEIKRILASQGKVIILQPNIKYLAKEYWDYFDHHMPLSDLSLCEGLQLSGFSIVKNYAKFLPYTTKSKIPQSQWLVYLYLKVPIVWKILGKQCCVIAQKK